MLVKLYSAALYGVDGFAVTVECSVKNMLSGFEIVGLPDNSVKESRERIRSAIEASGMRFPDAMIIINMAPADKKKIGSSFDLPMLVGILGGDRKIRCDLSDKCFIGELSLSGQVRATGGVLCMTIAAKNAGITEIYVPRANAREASVVKGVNIYPVDDVKSLVRALNGEAVIEKEVFDPKLLSECSSKKLDFADVKGQELAKRALEIAAAGGHNILFIGPPGTGKSMLAKRLPSILPEMSFEEALEVTKIHSIAGTLGERGFITERPFRSPHHTMSPVSLSGGGAVPSPGEISLAHNGVLFLDELPEFAKQVTEVLRQPLEDKNITITRAQGRFTFPSSFMLVCAMNPCRCGYFGHPTRPCKCKPQDIKKYISKISGPLLDRIDIQIEMPSLSYSEISDTTQAEPSAQIRKRVNAARAFARSRFEAGGASFTCNAAMGAAEVRKFCNMEEDASALLGQAYDSMGLSARGHDRMLKVARTIADLAGSDMIRVEHIAEAIQLRSLDRKYWN